MWGCTLYGTFSVLAVHDGDDAWRGMEAPARTAAGSPAAQCAEPDSWALR